MKNKWQRTRKNLKYGSKVRDWVLRIALGRERIIIIITGQEAFIYERGKIDISGVHGIKRMASQGLFQKRGQMGLLLLAYLARWVRESPLH